MTPTPNNFVSDQRKVNQKPLTVQEIFHRAKTQRAKLVIALERAGRPLSMRQLELATGIERPTICRRISELQESGLVRIDHYGVCTISRYPKVGYYVNVKGGSHGQGTLF
ncbi:hypothetical protein SAMN05421747_1048 [Parapedobacter composti]|uniref:HTH marR-type domain-containing protein n=1 Tax=Parapedobacter composti TaxID=623281 RepID=A0A1I1G6C6_9SPHI|nr:MarR family transcriptional regulator [Parapedobacter composti]SFC07277.1 hypothetical protein SAMN05421747_1048 [Parapedobacter composti]